MRTVSNKTVKTISFLVIILILSGIFWTAIPARQVSAQAGEPPAAVTPETSPTNRRIIFLEKAYQALQRFGHHIARDNERIPNILERSETLIAKLEEIGLDPAPIPQALAEFQQNVVLHQPEFEEGMSILTLHEGFDNNGKVVEPVKAAQTVNQARNALQTGHRGFHDALRQLREVLRQYREDHPQSPVLETPEA